MLSRWLFHSGDQLEVAAHLAESRTARQPFIQKSSQPVARGPGWEKSGERSGAEIKPLGDSVEAGCTKRFGGGAGQKLALVFSLILLHELGNQQRAEKSGKPAQTWLQPVADAAWTQH